MFLKGLYWLRYLEYSRVAQMYQRALQMLWLMSVGRDKNLSSSASHAVDEGAGDDGIS